MPAPRSLFVSLSSLLGPPQTSQQARGDCLLAFECTNLKTSIDQRPVGEGLRIESDVAKTTAKVMPFWMSFLQQPSGRSASDLVSFFFFFFFFLFVFYLQA